MQPNMEYIYTIYELGSIKQAAEHLCITQPALSISLKKTEEELGEPIFDRSTRPLELTPAGKIYIDGVKEISRIEGNMKTAISDLSDMNTGTLIIGGTQYFTSYILPPVLKHYIELYPHIKISIEESNSEQILKKLLNNQVDIMFNARTFDPSKFTIRPIFRDMLLLSAARHLIADPHLISYGITHQDVISGKYLSMPSLPDLRVFESLPFILLTEGNNLYLRSMELFRSASITPTILMQVEQLTTAHYFSCTGIGATFTTDKLIQRSAASDVLYFKIDSDIMTRNFNIILPKNRYISAAARKFIALCESDLKWGLV